MAFAIPFLLFSDPLVKKLTVKGIIGKTQGVKSATNPPKKPRIKIRIMLVEASTVSTFSQTETGFFKSTLPTSRG